MQIAPAFAAFEDKAVIVQYETAEATDVKDALDETWRRYNHAHPGYTGDLAEKHNTRSLSVGDVVLVSEYPKNGAKAAENSMFAWTRYFVVEGAGFQEVTKDGFYTWIRTVPRLDRSFGVKDSGYKIETPPLVPKAGMGATMQIGSDRCAYTISRVSKGGKVFWMKRDTATRTDKNGLSENQTYRYERNDSAGEQRVTLRKKDGRWRASGYDTTGSVALDVRAEYRDPSF